MGYCRKIYHTIYSLDQSYERISSVLLLQEYRLSAVPILKHTAHEMAKFHDYPRIHELLNCLKKAGMDEPQSVDEIIGACIIILKDDPAEVQTQCSHLKT